MVVPPAMKSSHQLGVELVAQPLLPAADLRGSVILALDPDQARLTCSAAAPSCLAPTAVTTATPAGVGRPQRRPGSCWSATTRPPRPPPVSWTVSGPVGSRTPPDWTIMSAACPCCCAARPGPGHG